MHWDFAESVTNDPCDAMPKGHLTYVVNAWGKPRSIEGLGVVFAEWTTEAGLPDRCRLHGLKKGGMRRLAEAGNTTHELMAISGHQHLVRGPALHSGC